MSTKYFHIRWNDHNGDGVGEFQGKHSDSDEWNPLSECEIETGTYNLHLHASIGTGTTGTRYDTAYVTFIEGEPDSEQLSWPWGVKLPDGAEHRVNGVEIAAGTTKLSFRAWRMISDDPKVKVNWSDGNQGSSATTSVQLSWRDNGPRDRGWSYKVDGVGGALGGDKTVILQNPEPSVSIEAKDETGGSDNRGGFYDLGSSGDSDVSREIQVHSLPHTVTYARPSDGEDTYKALNLFCAMQHGGTLPVSSSS